MGIMASSLELIRSVFNRDSVFPQQYGYYHWQTQYGIPYDPLMTDPSLHSGSQFSSYMQDQLRVHQNLIYKLADYEEMAEYPEIGMAYRIYADEATQQDSTHGQSVWVESTNEMIERIANFTLHKNLHIENILWDMAWEIAQNGNLYEEIVCIDNIGVIKINNMRAIEMRRVQDYNGELYGYIQDRTLAFTDVTTQEFMKRLKEGNKGNDMIKVYEPWEVAHFRFGAGRQMVYGMSVAEPARWAWKRLTLMEDAMVLYKLTRSAQRYVYVIDIGDKPPNAARAIIEKVKNDFKKQKFIDSNGKISFRYNPMCLDLDTKVPLLDGTTKTIRELITDHENGVKNFVYSIDRENQLVVPGEISWAGVTRRNAQVVKVTLDNGEELVCTPDHKIVIRDGSYCEAQNLVPGQSLMPFEISKDFTKVVIVEMVVLLDQTIDTGCITVEGHHNFGLQSGIFVRNSSDEDLFIAKRKGERAVDIDVLSGLDGQQTEDANYFREKLFASLGVPKSYLGADETIGRANLGNQDVRFAKSVMRLQRSLKNGIDHILRVDFASRNIDPDKIDYKIKMVVPSGALEIAHMEVKRTQAELAQLFQGLNFPEYYIWSSILGLTDDEIAKVWKARDTEQKAGESSPSIAPESVQKRVVKRIEDERKQCRDSRIEESYQRIAKEMGTGVTKLGRRLSELQGLTHEIKVAMRGSRKNESSF